VRELVREEPRAQRGAGRVGATTEDDVVADGEREGPHGARGGVRSRAFVNPHAPEALIEAGVHESPLRTAERTPGPDLLHEIAGRFRVRRSGLVLGARLVLLVLATRALAVDASPAAPGHGGRFGCPHDVSGDAIGFAFERIVDCTYRELRL